MVCLSPGVPSAGVLIAADEGVEACIALVSNSTSKASAGRKRAENFIHFLREEREIGLSMKKAESRGPENASEVGKFVQGRRSLSRTDSRAATSLLQTHVE